MRSLSIDFSAVSLTVDLLDTPTADGDLGRAPLRGEGAHLGRGGLLLHARLGASREGRESRRFAGEIAFWTDGDAIAIGFGPTPVSQGAEIRLASPANIWATARGDVRTLAAVRPGEAVRVRRL